MISHFNKVQSASSTRKTIMHASKSNLCAKMCFSCVVAWQVSRWVSCEIVQTYDLKERVALVTKFVKIAKECRMLNNFNAVMEIVSGLNSSPVHRLKKTWKV